jgi:hypothetical protein
VLILLKPMKNGLHPDPKITTTTETERKKKKKIGKRLVDISRPNGARKKK